MGLSKPVIVFNSAGGALNLNDPLPLVVFFITIRVPEATATVIVLVVEFVIFDAESVTITLYWKLFVGVGEFITNVYVGDDVARAPESSIGA